MPSAVCQGWGNVRCSNNASVLCSVKWWKRPVITGIIKPVRGSSMDGFVYCLPLSQHHKLLGLHFLSSGLQTSKDYCNYICLRISKNPRVMTRAVSKSCIRDVPLTVLSVYSRLNVDDFIFLCFTDFNQSTATRRRVAEILLELCRLRKTDHRESLNLYSLEPSFISRYTNVLCTIFLDGENIPF